MIQHLARRTWIAAAVTLVVHSCDRFAIADDPPKVTVQQVVDAWKARAQQIKSGRFKWTETQWIPKGAPSAPAASTMAGSSSSGPAKDQVVTYEHELLFDGERLRHTQSGPQWDSIANDFIDGPKLCIWDGSVSKSQLRGTEYERGRVSGEVHSLSLRELTPMRLSLRPSHEHWYPMNLQNYEVNRTETIDGSRCVVVETSRRRLERNASKGGPPWKRSYWVCPEKDFSILRFTRVSNKDNALAEELNVTCRQDPSGIWYPATWKFVDGGDKSSAISEGQVTDVALNAPIEEEVFHYDFPVGAWVDDRRSDESYIVRPGGDKRIVLTAELARGATYEQLMVTDVGMAATAKINRGIRPWLLWSGIGLVCLLAGAVFWRRNANG